MSSDRKAMVSELASYALSKPGAQPQHGMSAHDPAAPTIVIPGEEIPTILLSYDGSTELSLPNARPAKIDEAGDDAAMTIPLDGSVTLETIRGFIDASYAQIVERLSATARLKLELIDAANEPLTIVDRLIDAHGMQAERDAIHHMLRPALLLSHGDGAGRLGGRPTLKQGTPWPTSTSGQPLPFVAQLDLAQLAAAGPSVQGLPASGTLALFSLWSHVHDDDGLDAMWSHKELAQQPGWTQAVYAPAGAATAEQDVPEGLPRFPACSLMPHPILSLPNHDEEHSGAAKTWSKELVGRYDDVQSDYREVMLAHHVGNMAWHASHHLVGGYAVLQQSYPPDLVSGDRIALCQVGSDDSAGMCWGDGGMLAFYADRSALSQGRFERLWAECQ